jgi:hypothetical protein
MRQFIPARTRFYRDTIGELRRIDEPGRYLIARA